MITKEHFVTFSNLLIFNDFCVYNKEGIYNKIREAYPVHYKTSSRAGEPSIKILSYTTVTSDQAGEAIKP